MTRNSSSALGHYQGDEGQAYFEWQDQLGKWAGIWNARFFQPLIRPTDKILDFGCGAGHLLAVLKAGHKVGVEINPAARRVAIDYGLKVVARVGDLGDERFDVVLSSHTLEHVPSPLETLVALQEHLLSDGRLLLLLPLEDWRSSEQRKFHRDDISMHLYCWTPQSLGNLLRAVGLEPVAIKVITRAFPPLGPFLWQAGRPLFEVAAVLTAFLKRRRQLFACSRPRSTAA